MKVSYDSEMQLWKNVSSPFDVAVHVVTRTTLRVAFRGYGSYSYAHWGQNLFKKTCMYEFNVVSTVQLLTLCRLLSKFA